MAMDPQQMMEDMMEGPGPGLPGMPGLSAPEEAGQAGRHAPTFPDPEPITFSEEEQEDIVAHISSRYENNVIARDNWNNRHQVYDQMYRGKVEQFSDRTGPWENASRLHVQMPYWLVDSINARLVHTIWSQNPLVQASWEEDDDEENARKAARMVQWHLQSKRMDARAMWGRLSKIRLTHGVGVGLLSYVNDIHTYRTLEADEEGGQEPLLNPDGSPQVDEETGLPITRPAFTATAKQGTFYRGPVLYPLEWDDTVVPIGAMNLQPNRPSNPGGADWVILRQFELLSLMRRKADASLPAYPEFWEGRDNQWWIDNAGDQTRSVADRGDQNTQRVRQQDLMEGTDRTQAVARRADIRSNPEFEVYTYLGPWEHPESGEEEEMVIFCTRRPDVFLGAFRLTDLVWTGHRPLLELHYQTVSNRFYSMGVCEICEHLSEEIDVLHNMRVDVGQATNLPWYFVRAGSGINPSNIKLRPMEMVPVDNPNDVVAPQTQNVTSFYHQEESLLLTIVERVMGVTDLFLGVSPTKGASARHATGFLGTQQEAEARMSEPLRQDADAFAFLCRLVRDLEVQYGPEYRTFRLLGEGGVEAHEMSRDDLWMQGQYDLRLGANVGMYSQMFRYQRAQAAYQYLAQSPLVMQDPGRRWEIEAEVLTSLGYTPAEVASFIGPKEAISQGSPKSQDEENAQMIQYLFGADPAPVHPGDDDQKHIADVDTFLSSEMYNELGRPNEMALQQHKLLHQQAMVRKQQQMVQQQAQQQGAQQQGPQGPPQQGASTAARAAAQVSNVPSGSPSVFGDVLRGFAGQGGNGAGSAGPPPGAIG